ncbi:FAD-binding oxidoreductase [Nonomuraea pusilla]|uniref:Glycolate oxidase FAD binding subunit n=1 Tax=Nonomuraea pusilla TaxID=46177 RepID=A0A1H7S806_9ACTN|nr:FAD-binding oxidoreductase [Nonomuraea pusilla]SEL68750.1 glycolate oxidase FAD binding subunit [Nonomuraea pusilla]
MASRDVLAATGVALRGPGPGDLVGGVTPGVVALPESVEEIAAVLRACAGAGLAVVPAGGGTKLHWGAPPERCDVLLDLCCLNRVLEHAAGDLVVRVQAGVTVDALAATLGGKGQELALDVPFDSGATVGGTLAVGAAGPRSFRYGAARDLLIGVTVVLADGTVAKSGGKVVKNVAGYDLGKLFTGSYGTLGVIAEAAFRLHPLPARRRWLTAELAAGEVTGGLVAALAASQAEPSAVEVDRPAGGRVALAALVEGEAAEERALAVRDLLPGTADGEVGDTAPAWWGLLPGERVLVEARFPPASTAAVLAAAEEAGFALRGSPVSGRTWLTARDSGERELREAVTRLRGRVEGEGGRVTVPASPYEGVDRWGRVGALPLMRRVKERFDPGRVMSPGRFVGGI